MKKNNNTGVDVPEGANIAGAPIEEPDAGISMPSVIPGSDGNGEYHPRHLADGETDSRSLHGGQNCDNMADGGAGFPARGDYIPQPDGSNIAPNGAVIRNPWSEMPEIKPDHAYTDEKEDLNLLIM